MRGEWKGGKGSVYRPFSYSKILNNSEFLNKREFDVYVKTSNEYIGRVSTSSSWLAARYLAPTYNIEELNIIEV